MTFTQRLSVLFTVLGLFIAAPSAHAGHIGGYLGDSIFTYGMTAVPSKAQLTGGLDAAMNFTPLFELGAFWNHCDEQTLAGAELLFYPLIYKLVYLEAKGASATMQDGSSHFAYGPGAGANLEIIPMLISIGVDATYYFYTTPNLNNLSILGNLKVWF